SGVSQSVRRIPPAGGPARAAGWAWRRNESSAPPPKSRGPARARRGRPRTRAASRSARCRRTGPSSCARTGSPSRLRRASAARRLPPAQLCPPEKSGARRQNARAGFYHAWIDKRLGIRWYSPARERMAWYKREDSDDVFSEEKRSVPAGVFTKCPGCRAALLTADLDKNAGVCPQCDHHFPVTAVRRLEQVLDPGTFTEADGSIESVDPLGFRDSKRYADRLRAARRNAGGADAVLVGAGLIEGLPVELGIFVFEFMGGSMGSVVGEKVTRVFE